MGISINCRERLEYKADGAQKPECTCEYMRISSNAQRSNHDAQQINRGALMTQVCQKDGNPFISHAAPRNRCSDFTGDAASRQTIEIIYESPGLASLARR